MEPLLLPSIAGEFKNWNYWQVIMSVNEIANNLGTEENPEYRIKTVSEVEVIYSREGISNMLQRQIDPSRIEPIKNYLQNQPDSYINNITVGIYGGDPQWNGIDVKKSSLQFEENEEINEESSRFGFIRLRGDETLFVLDGQHRLRALRKSLEDGIDIGDEKISVTLIPHIDNEEGIQRTRRLFSTINRHAVPVSLGENILLDEDDLSAIMVRNLIEEYHHFQNKKVIALNKTKDLKRSDVDKFTTVIALYDVNEVIIENKEIYPKYIGGKKDLVRVRPDDEIIDSYKIRIFDFWDNVINKFPEIAQRIENRDFSSRREGGSFYLRPVGQQLLVILFKKYRNIYNQLELVEANINSDFWHYILWDPHKSKVISNVNLAVKYIKYHFGLDLSDRELSQLQNSYVKNSGETKSNLPSPQRRS